MAQQQTASTVNTTAQQGLMGMPQHQIISTPTVMQINNIGHQQKPSTTDGTGTMQSGLVNMQSFVGNQQTLQQIQHNPQQIVTSLPQHQPNQVQGTTSVTSNVLPTNFSNTNSMGSSQGASGSSSKGATTNTAQANHDATTQLLSRNRLLDLIRDVDPSVQLDEEVEDVLINIAECFVESIAEGSCRVAKHRQMNSIAVSDVQLYLEQQYKIWVPGFGTDELRPFKRAIITEAHKQRTSLIRKARKN